MVTMVTMSERLSLSIFSSSQIALAHQPVHVKMTLTILLISIGVKQLSDFAKKGTLKCMVHPHGSHTIYKESSTGQTEFD